MAWRQVEEGDRAGTWAASAIAPDPYMLPAEIELNDSDLVARISRDAVAFCDPENGKQAIFYVPVRQYRGIAMTVAACDDDPAVISALLILHHDDPHLSVPLFVSFDTDEVVKRWKAWGQSLDRPLIVRGLDGDLRHVREDVFDPPKQPPAKDRPPLMMIKRREDGPRAPLMSYDGLLLIGDF